MAQQDTDHHPNQKHYQEREEEGRGKRTQVSISRETDKQNTMKRYSVWKKILLNATIWMNPKDMRNEINLSQRPGAI